MYTAFFEILKLKAAKGTLEDRFYYKLHLMNKK